MEKYKTYLDATVLALLIGGLFYGIGKVITLMLLDKFNKKAERYIRNHVGANYMKINVTSGELIYNFKCHLNAVHFARRNRNSKIALCFYLAGETPIIHFINYDGKKYIDNTLGEWSSEYYYYFVRFVDKEEFYDIDNIFGYFRNEIRNKLPLHIKLLSNYEA